MYVTIISVQVKSQYLHRTGAAHAGCCLQVSQVAGGVGRNIAEAAHQMLQDKDRQQQQQLQAVHLISVLGRDAAADALLASFTHLG